LDSRYVDALVALGGLYNVVGIPPAFDQAERFRKSAELAERALDIDPQNGPAHCLRGEIFIDAGEPLLALPHIQRAVDLNPHDPNPHTNLGLIYQMMGFWESSLIELERSIERDPLLVTSCYNRVFVLMQLGRFPEAHEAIGSLEGGPGWDAALARARVFLHTGHPKQAEAVLKESRPLKPSVLVNRFDVLLAVARAAQGRPDVARAALKRVATLGRGLRDDIVLLGALAGEKDLVVEEMTKTSISSYRWLISEPLLRPYRSYAPFQKRVRDLYQRWQSTLAAVGPSLPVQPPKLPGPDEYLSQPISD
jgi:hypothetical protein